MNLRSFPAALLGVAVVGVGLAASVCAGLMGIIGGDWVLLAYYASSVTIFLGVFLIILDLLVFLPHKRRRTGVMCSPLENMEMTVILTAYNDELSIRDAVKDFQSQPLVKRVIVVDNNSSDGTAEAAALAGAIVIREPKQGYGQCVFRGLNESVKYDDTELTLLCEGDCTFRAFDINKFAAYLPHADIVNGTRIVEQLRAPKTQLTTFMYYGNFFVGKLVELKHLGKGTFTDVGTTYKLCRKSALKRALPHLNPEVNLEFNAHFMDIVLGQDLLMVECPVTFFSRVGVSKGGNVNDLRAIQVGLRMIKGLCFGWTPRSLT